MQELCYDNFYSTIQNGISVVNVGASWCRDCRFIEPIMQALENEYRDSVRFFKVSFDNETKLKDELKITRIPTLIFYKNAKEIGMRLIEPKSRMEIETILKQILS